MTGLRKRTGLSLCAKAASTTSSPKTAVLMVAAAVAATILIVSGFTTTFIHHAECVPVKLVADFPTFAATLLGSLGHDHQDQGSGLLVTSSSSSSYLTNDQSDEDPDDPSQLSAKAVDGGGSSSSRSKATIFTDYEVDLEKIQSSVSAGGVGNSTGQSAAANTTGALDDGDDTVTTAIVATVDSNSSTTKNGPPGASKGNAGDTSSVLTLIGGNKKSHIIRLPNGQSFQFCDELIELSCRDENAVCKMGACVCKPGFFLHRQAGLCQSISDLLKNCENDYQCQAFDVDLICDTKSHERSFCDCAEGLYFDQETYSCIPCHRNTFVISTTTTATSNKEVSKKVNQTQPENGSQANATESTLASANTTATNSVVEPSLDANSTSASNSTATTTVAPQQPSRTTTLRPCKPIDLAKLTYRRRKQQHQVPYSSMYDQPARGSSSYSTASTTSTTSTSYHHGSSSDPFRIKTPLEVFMGAIMLFTLLTVAWFFLQRMFHDCRVILRSLRNPDFTGHCGPDGTSGGASSHLAGIVPSSRPGSQLYLDPAGQAVARLLSTDGYNSSLAGIYQRDLAGVMVQHLAANLSPSSTSHALASTNGSLARGENDINLYPLTISSQQSRSAAAAAAAQLLLSPSHPAIAILRAAAASANQNHNHLDHYNQTSLLNSMLDPPPKYEEAIAQSEANQPSSYVPQQHDNQISSSRASDDNEANRDNDNDDQDDEVASENGQFDATGRLANNNDQQNEARNDSSTGGDAAVPGDSSLPPSYHSGADQHPGRVGSSSTTSSSSSNGPSETEQTNSGRNRQNSTSRKKVTRRSRRGRGSTSRNNGQQHANQDSDDTLTESH